MRYLIALFALAIAAGAHAQSSTSTTTAQSAAVTNSTAGATNAGNAQSIQFNSDSGHASTSVRTNPTVYVPSPAVSYSALSCANGWGVGGSGGYVGIGFGGATEGDKCEGRANATMLMQMSNNLRPINARTADALTLAAINIMCDQDDKVRAKMVEQGLCTSADYAGNKRDYTITQTQPYARRQISTVGYYPNTGGN